MGGDLEVLSWGLAWLAVAALVTSTAGLAWFDWPAETVGRAPGLFDPRTVHFGLFGIHQGPIGFSYGDWATMPCVVSESVLCERLSTLAWMMRGCAVLMILASAAAVHGAVVTVKSTAGRLRPGDMWGGPKGWGARAVELVASLPVRSGRNANMLSWIVALAGTAAAVATATLAVYPLFPPYVFAAVHLHIAAFALPVLAACAYVSSR